MLRPTISDSQTGHRARRISPTPPALLVGPSWLLRGDDAAGTRPERSRYRSPWCGSPVKPTVSMTQKRTPTGLPRPFIWRAHSMIELKTCVRRSVTMTTASS